MTSNITLLTNERVKFLVDNDVVLFVSLDGPAAVNDANRIYPDGRGTHARVIERLAYIRSQYPVYSRKRIYVHCTFDIPNDIWKIFHYFSEPLLRELSVEIHPLNRGDSEVTTVSNDEANQHFERLDRLVESYLDRLGSRTYFNYSLFHNVFKDVFGDLAARKLGIASTNEGPNGVCIPGRNMLFVGSNGSFYTCHKFSQEGNEIGNCEDGVDIKRVQNLLRGFVSFYNENCQECWAFRLCKHCFVHCLEGGRISESRRKRSCELEKERIVEALERFIYIWENEPDVAFENEFSLHSTVRSHQAKESKT
jgi:uncharacterized protein